MASTYITQTFDLKTDRRDQMINISSQLASTIAASGVQNGLAVVHVPHTTAGVTINENADPDVTHDMLKTFDKLIDWSASYYRHGEGNSAAHLKSTLTGCSQTIIIADGVAELGIWQGLWFCEFDGPRSRRFVIRVQGD